MISDFIFGNNEKDFKKWCRISISRARTIIDRYEKHSFIYDYTPDKTYYAALSILRQYIVLKHALNPEQQDILDYCLIEGDAYPFDIRRERALTRYIFSLWQEICFNKKKPILKQIDYVFLGHHLRLLRNNRSLTVQRVARMLNISVKTLYDYESGVRAISLNALYGLSQIYETSIDRIIAEYKYNIHK